MGFEDRRLGDKHKFEAVKQTVDVRAKEQAIRGIIDRRLLRCIAVILAHNVSVKPILLFRRDEVCHIRCFFKSCEAADQVTRVDCYTETGDSIRLAWRGGRSFKS